MDVDATQVIDDFSCYDDETDDEEQPAAAEERKPVAYLKVLTHKDVPEKLYPVYDGDNFVGRGANECSICLPFKSLSKKHAGIEVSSEIHLVYDLGSRNKTRRDKLSLRPQVRYELCDNDRLTFADVQCVYQKVTSLSTAAAVKSPAVSNVVHTLADTSSDAGAVIGNMTAPTEVSSTPTVSTAAKLTTLFQSESDSDSDASSDILLGGTESAGIRLSDGNTAQQKAFVESSFLNNSPHHVDERTGSGLEQLSLTAGGIDVSQFTDKSTNDFVPESDPEDNVEDDDTEGSPEKCLVEETQAFDDDSFLPKLSVKPTLNMKVLSAGISKKTTSGDSQTAPTQVFPFEDLPTQAFSDDDDVRNFQKNCGGDNNMATLAYDLEPVNKPCAGFLDADATQIEDDLAWKNPPSAPAHGNSQDIPSQSHIAATQVFDAVVSDRPPSVQSQTFVAATQVFADQVTADTRGTADLDSTQVLDPQMSGSGSQSDVMATQVFGCRQSVGIPSGKKNCGSSLSDIAATQVFDQRDSIRALTGISPRASESLTDLSATQVFNPKDFDVRGISSGASGAADIVGKTGSGLESDLAATQSFADTKRLSTAADRSRMSFSPNTCSTQVIASSSDTGFPRLALDISVSENDNSRKESLGLKKSPQATKGRDAAEDGTGVELNNACMQVFDQQQHIVSVAQEAVEKSRPVDPISSDPHDDQLQALNEIPEPVAKSRSSRGRPAGRGKKLFRPSLARVEMDDLPTQVFRDSPNEDLMDENDVNKKPDLESIFDFPTQMSDDASESEIPCGKKTKNKKAKDVSSKKLEKPKPDRKSQAAAELPTQVFEEFSDHPIGQTKKTYSRREKLKRNESGEGVKNVSDSELPTQVFDEFSSAAINSSVKKTAKQASVENSATLEVDAVSEKEAPTGMDDAPTQVFDSFVPPAAPLNSRGPGRLHRMSAAAAAAKNSGRLSCNVNILASEKSSVTSDLPTTDDLATQVFDAAGGGDEFIPTQVFPQSSAVETGLGKRIGRRGKTATSSNTDDLATQVFSEVETSNEKLNEPRRSVGRLAKPISKKIVDKEKLVKGKEMDEKSGSDSVATSAVPTINTDDLATQVFELAPPGGPNVVVEKTPATSRKMSIAKGKNLKSKENNMDDLATQMFDVAPPGESENIAVAAVGLTAVSAKSSTANSHRQDSTLSSESDLTVSVSVLPATKSNARKCRESGNTNQPEIKKTTASVAETHELSVATENAEEIHKQFDHDLTGKKSRRLSTRANKGVHKVRDDFMEEPPSREKSPVPEEPASTRKGTRGRKNEKSVKEDLRAATPVEEIETSSKGKEHKPAVETSGRKRKAGKVDASEGGTAEIEQNRKAAVEKFAGNETESQPTGKTSRRRNILTDFTESLPNSEKSSEVVPSSQMSDDDLPSLRMLMGGAKGGLRNLELLAEDKNLEDSEEIEIIGKATVDTPAIESSSHSRRHNTKLHKSKSPPSMSTTSRSTPMVGLATDDAPAVAKKSTGASSRARKTGSKADEVDVVVTTTVTSTSESEDDRSAALSHSGRSRGKKSNPVASPATKPLAPATPRDVKPSPRGSSASKFSATPDSQKKLLHATIPPPKVMFTGVVDENGEKIVKSLGGEMVESVFECTHLVTDQVRRTVKFLCGVARGLLIVTPEWLERCKSAGTFLDGSTFLVQDSANEKKFKFSLSSSLQTAADHRLLAGYKIHVTKNVKPEPNQMRDIIQCAGGQFLASAPRKFEDQLIVVSCDDDTAACRTMVDWGIPIVSSEFLLTGILRQQIDTESFRLASKATPAPGSSAAGNKRVSFQPSPVPTKSKRK